MKRRSACCASAAADWSRRPPRCQARAPALFPPCRLLAPALRNRAVTLQRAMRTLCNTSRARWLRRMLSLRVLTLAPVRTAPAAPTSALDLLHAEQRRRHIITFCAELDGLLGGGVAPGEITECVCCGSLLVLKTDADVASALVGSVRQGRGRCVLPPRADACPLPRAGGGPGLGKTQLWCALSAAASRRRDA